MAKRDRKRQPKPSADRDLSDANFDRLNRTFYEMSPHGYLRRRLKSLFLWHGNPPGLEELLAEEFRVDEIAVRLGADSEHEDKEQRERFALIEAEVLLHHVSETLLRLYLVHAQGSPCPWLDISRESKFSAFKKEVSKLRERLESEEELGKIEQVFFGTSNREELKPVPDLELWGAGKQNIASFLNYFAGHFLDPAPYNAAKHGLALLAGRALRWGRAKIHCLLWPNLVRRWSI